MTHAHGRAEDSTAQNYEGDIDVPLAPVMGLDERRLLPREWFVRKPAVFIAKFVLAMLLILTGWLAIYLFQTWPVVIIVVIVNGLLYAHLVELQHECLHGHAFDSPWLNRLFGVLCGIFMSSSHSHYRYDHLRHHAHLGTPQNKEHFDYRFQDLDSLYGFARSVFDLSRFKRVARLTALSFAWRHLPGIEKASYDRDIKQEYILNFVLLVTGIVFTLQTGSLLVALAWWLPALLISEGTHFLIEMPEHFGLNTQTNPNVLTNTRTINTSAFVSWFVNGNDVHTAHHFHQGVPMCNVRKLNGMVKSRFAVIEPSYRRFFGDVIAGRIRQHEDATCMQR